MMIELRNKAGDWALFNLDHVTSMHPDPTWAPYTVINFADPHNDRNLRQAVFPMPYDQIMAAIKQAGVPVLRIGR